MSGIKRGWPKGNGRYSSGGASRAEIKEHLTLDEIIGLVFEARGGVDGMADWVRQSERNESLFYSKIFPKLLELEPDPKDKKLNDPYSDPEAARKELERRLGMGR